MMEIKNTIVFGIAESICRSKFPLSLEEVEEVEMAEIDTKGFKRMEKLGRAKVGSGHDNFLKGIIVQFDLRYPQYFTPQLQRYHWIDIVSSQSKMHTITKREKIDNDCNGYVDKDIINRINDYILKYNKSEDKDYWFNKIISNLPMGFMLWMGISTNYLQLKTIYFQRKNHKLKEWKYFCDWILELPYMKDILL